AAARHGSAAEMLTALQGVLAEMNSTPATEMVDACGPLPPPPGGVPRPPAADTIPARAPRRLRAILWPLAAVILLATAAMVYWYWTPPDAARVPPVKGPPGVDPGSRAGLFPERIPKAGWPFRLGGNVRTVAFSRDNKWFAAGSLNRHDGDGDGAAALWP